MAFNLNTQNTSNLLFERMRQALEPVPAHHTNQSSLWMRFDRFMQMALYEPMLGYYTGSRSRFGHSPIHQGSGYGSDFVTAPELSSIFGRTLSHQIQQALVATNTEDIWEFGAGSGQLAVQILQAMQERQPEKTIRYHIIELSGALKEQQQQKLPIEKWHSTHSIEWHSTLPSVMQGVVIGNEVLDAVPVQLLHRQNGQWYERGVCLNANQSAWEWMDVATELRPPFDIQGKHDYLTEIHPQAHALMSTLCDRLTQGCVIWIDYGFPEAEYYHEQRHMGSLVCHHLHQMDSNPLVMVGEKDITAHVNFTDIALAAQNADWEILGYTSQGRFLINCQILNELEQASLMEKANAAKLIHEHEMGELFKVLMLAPKNSANWQAIGFRQGQRPL